MTARDDLQSIASMFPIGRDFRIRCVFCIDGRSIAHQSERTLSVTRHADRTVFLCWHCQASGALPPITDAITFPSFNPSMTRTVPKMSTPVNQAGVTDLTKEDVTWLKTRGLSKKVADRLQLRSHARGVAFPCGSPPVGYKVRSLSRKDFIVVGTLPSLMGLERAVGDELVITEGEVDWASLVEADVLNAASVPHGAGGNFDRSPSDTHVSAKLSFLHHDEDRLKSLKKIVLYCDNDDPGRALQAELARRLGKARCWEVTHPEGCKDANDVLLKFGPERLREVIEQARPMQIPGLRRAEDFRTDLLRLRAGNMGRGVSTGLASLDPFLTVAPGNWTCVTGNPGAGKSEIVDQIHVNVMERMGWNVGIWSAENQPHEHIAKLIEKKMRKRFHPGMANRMTDAEMEEGYAWVEQHCNFLTGEESSTIDSILDRLSGAVMRYGIKLASIDPFNYIAMSGAKRDDLEISDMLSKVGDWVRSHEAHLFFVAHPKTLPTGDIIPKGRQISGGASWWAKADNGLTAHRPDTGSFVELHVWKVRRAHLGSIGSAEVGYNKQTASYYDLDEIGVKMAPQFEQQAKARSREIKPHWYEGDDKD